MRTAGLFSVALLVLQLPSKRASATILEAWDTNRLTKESSFVVIGQIGSQISRSPDGRNIVTDTTVRIEQYVAGQGPAALTVRQFGGVIGDRAQMIAGSPRLTVGSRVLLFVVHSNGHYWVAGMAQGVYEIKAGVATCKLDVPVLRGGGVQKAAPRTLPLVQLVGEVRQAAALNHD